MVNGAKQVNIPLGYGIHRTPSIGTDGELSECVNLIPKHGELVNIQPPKDITFTGSSDEPVEKKVSLGSQDTLMAVHKTSLYTHYIVLTDSSIRREQGKPRKKAPQIDNITAEVSQEPDPLGNTVNVDLYMEGVPADGGKFVLTMTNGNTIHLAISDEGEISVKEEGVEVEDVETSGQSGHGRRYHFTLSLDNSGDNWKWNDLNNQIIEFGPDPEHEQQQGESHTVIPVDATINLYEENSGDLPEDEKTITNELAFYTLSWTNTGSEGDKFHEICTAAQSDPIKSVKTIGNTLVVLFADRIEYYLWRDDKYVSLGSGLPDLDIRLALKGEFGFNYRENQITLSKGNGSNFTLSFHIVDNQYNLEWDYTEQSFSANTPYKIVNQGPDPVYLVFYGVNNKIVKNTTTVGRGKELYVTFPEVVVKVHIFVSTFFVPRTDLMVYSGTASNNTVVVENTQENYTAILGVANKFINDAEKEGKFVTPFYARVGLRLYDQSVSRLTVPILMTPNTRVAPWIVTTVTPSVDGQTGEGSCGISSLGFKANLQYYIEAGVLNKLKDWEDIITGITIAITPPLYTYNQGAKYEEDKEIFRMEGFQVIGGGKPDREFGYMYGKYGDSYGQISSSEVIDEKDIFGTQSLALGLIHLPSFDEAEVRKNYTEFAQFNVLKNIDINDVEANQWVDIDTSDIDVSLSENWELVPDDNLSNDTLSASLAYTYNSRLHLAGMSRHFWPGKFPDYMVGYTNTLSVQARVIVKIVEDNTTYYTDTGWSNYRYNRLWYWFYYPNVNATTAIIYRRVLDQALPGEPAYKYSKTELTLEKHKTLNGAFWFKDYDPMPFTLSDEEEATQSYDIRPYVSENMLYVSEANNPFVFPVTQRISVGDGEIIGLSTTAKALSEGQYGEFPLYVFCTDGVWTLSVGNTGSYSSVHPLSRDVCTNPDSITQLDGAVVFVTKQGLKMVAGSDIVLLSEELNGYNVPENFFTEAEESFFEKFRVKPNGSLNKNILIPDTTQFIEQVQTAKIAYDYPHNLLHVFTGLSTEDGQERHYVYSLDEKQWSTQVLDDICYAIVPGYPLTTLQLDQVLCQYDNFISSDKRLGYALTRINCLGNPLSRKMLYDLRTVGHYYSDGARRIAVYVSNDKQNWYRLDALKKLSCRYYRFLLLTYQTDTDTINGMTAQIVEKFTNKMR